MSESNIPKQRADALGRGLSSLMEHAGEERVVEGGAGEAPAPLPLDVVGRIAGAAAAGTMLVATFAVLGARGAIGLFGARR